MMKKVLAVAALAAVPALFLSAETKKGSWTGYVTDTHCGKNAASEKHTADCVDKCMKGGAKAQLWNEADQKTYDLDSFDKVRSLMGGKVTVSGSLDTATNTIKVDSAAKSS